MANTNAGRLGLAGGICTLLGVGLARFAYTPLIPALVDAGWFSTRAADYLGAVNLLGYLVGAVLAHRVTERFGVRAVLAASLAVTVASFYGCALDWGAIWCGVWRLACGVSGAMLVVVGVPAALSRVQPGERAGTGARVFLGIGLGIAASGTLVPWLIDVGIAAAWLAFALAGTALALWSWWAVWRDLAPLDRHAAHTGQAAPAPGLTLSLVIAAYALDAAGFVPHTLFWVDYIAHELGRGIAVGGRYWIVFGAGAICGPFVAGALARRLGFRTALAAILGVKTAAVALPLASSAPVALGVSSFVVGMLVPASVTLTSGSLAELAPPQRQQQVWGWATLAFAVLQAVAAYGMSWVYDDWGSYRPLFALAAAALAAGTISAALAAARRDG
ncbi:YbfB/YjiJ family MFS transporter [Salinisphaera sp. RV14]|uniref:YbfB/YjiJ family MFS transporter n=1 Tax=unclassified Salinisphaera TaxID=2649847 RepID=UPI003F874F0F